MQRLVRHAGYDHDQLYRFYNMGHPDYPNLKPPSNPEKLALFFSACIERTIKDMNKENGAPEPKEQNPVPGFRRQMTP